MASSKFHIKTPIIRGRMALGGDNNTPSAARKITVEAQREDIVAAATPPPVDPELEPFNVSAQIIKKLSAQMYRSPANALKEMVSNSFDAEAHQVRIGTNPMLDKITVIDDGEGMTADEFIHKMQNIAAEAKRKEIGETTEGGRPVIGKLGVGLLAVGQMSNKLTVMSKPKGGTDGFLAKVDLSKFFREDAATRRVDEIESAIRLWRLKDMGGAKTSFTAIILEDMRQTFKDEFLFNRPNFIEGFRFDKLDPKSFEKFVKFYMERRGEGKVPALDEMIWELGTIAPVQYMEGGPIHGSKEKHPILARIGKRLESYNFHVYVNDVEIRKPVFFPNEDRAKEEGSDWKVYEFEFDEKVGNRTIRGEGYFYHQAFRIMPPGLRGILPRIRGVGIGDYDRTLFAIPAVLGPVAIAQTSGEVYVDEGLEEALNIDRNSFDRIDPGYQKVRDLVLAQLQVTPPESASILTDIRQRQKRRRQKSKLVKTERFYESVSGVLKEAGYPGWSLKRFKSARVPPVEVDPARKTIGLYNSDLYPKKNIESMSEAWKTIVLILIMRDVAHHLASPWSKEAEDDVFYRLLTAVLG